MKNKNLTEPKLLNSSIHRWVCNFTTHNGNAIR